MAFIFNCLKKGFPDIIVFKNTQNSRCLLFNFPGRRFVQSMIKGIDFNISVKKAVLMKFKVKTGIFSVLMVMGLFFVLPQVLAQESTPPGSQQMSDTQNRMVDQHATRIMELEDELHTLRREFSRQFSSLEERYIQEHTLLREYIELSLEQTAETETRMEEQIADIQSGMEEIDSALENLSLENNILRDSFADIQSSHDQLQQSMADLRDSQQELASDLEPELERISGRLDSIADEHARHMEALQELDELHPLISEVSQELERTETRIEELSSRIEAFENRDAAVQELEQRMEGMITDLSERISYADQGLAYRLEETDSSLQALDSRLEERTVYMGGITLAAALLGLIGLVAGIAARRGKQKVNVKLEETSSELKREFMEQQALQDTRLSELLENLAEVMPEPGKYIPVAETEGPPVEMDHSLAISLGEEIYRLVKRIKSMPEDHHLAPELKSSISRLFKALKNKGYKIVDLEGKPYSDDMQAKAEFVLTHELLPGEQIVSRVKKPLIKYQDEVVQQAEIEVLVGE